jgi:HEAT repeat protein
VGITRGAAATKRPKEGLPRLFVERSRGNVEYLIAALRDPECRILAAKFLRERREQRAVPALLLMLDQSLPNARAAAARALAEIRASESLPKLREVVESDPVPVVREWAVEAIGRIGGPSATEYLIGLLADPDPKVRRHVATALGWSGDPAAAVPIRVAAAREPWSRRSPYRRALRSLRRVGV